MEILHDCLHYREPPSDFTIDEADRLKFVESIGAVQRDIVLADVTYSLTAVPTPWGETNWRIACAPECQTFALLLTDLLEGRAITVSQFNAQFLEEFSRSYNLDKLNVLTARHLAAPTSLPVSLLFRIRDVILNVFGGFGFFGRLICTFWDLFGTLVVLSCLINLAVALMSMGLYQVANQGVVFVFILLPYSLFVLTFSTLFSIPALEMVEFRLLHKGETFFATHQRLILTFLRLTPLKIKRNKPFSSGHYYDVIFGILFVAFGLSIMWQINMVPGISDGMEGFVLIFAIGIPPIKYIALYFLYACHSFASLFPSCRQRFLENGEFSDPFLCSIYFGRTAWRDFWHFCREERSAATAGTIVIAFLKAFFSKTTAAAYLIVASTAFLIAQRSLVSAGEAFGFVFIIFVLAIPLCSTISFPFFLIGSFRSQKPTNNQVRREFAAIARSEFPRDVFFRYVSHSR
jgi:hypothetical protein